MLHIRAMEARSRDFVLPASRVGGTPDSAGSREEIRFVVRELDASQRSRIVVSPTRLAGVGKQSEIPEKKLDPFGQTRTPRGLHCGRAAGLRGTRGIDCGNRSASTVTGSRDKSPEAAADPRAPCSPALEAWSTGQRART